MPRSIKGLTGNRSDGRPVRLVLCGSNGRPAELRDAGPAGGVHRVVEEVVRSGGFGRANSPAVGGA